MSNEHQVSFERDGDDWKCGSTKAQNHVLKFDKDTGPHIVKFHIGTPTGRYVFSEKDPIWLKADDGKCPRIPCYEGDIEVENCGQTMLTIKNKNEVKGKLRYQLNVYDRQNEEYCPIDPVIDNGGHG